MAYLMNMWNMIIFHVNISYLVDNRSKLSFYCKICDIYIGLIKMIYIMFFAICFVLYSYTVFYFISKAFCFEFEFSAFLARS